MRDEGHIHPWLLAAALALALLPLTVVHPVRVSGRSMEPLIRDGELCWALRAWCAGAPAPGEVWLLRTPTGPAIKRLIALPATQVELRDGALSVEGKALDEPYVKTREWDSSGTWSTGNGYFFLGDNRRESHDSRAWGALPVDALQSRLWVR